MLIKVFPKTTLKINKPLIYECDIKINIGDIVKIPIGNKETLGIVVDKIKNTSFNFQIRKIIHNDNEYIPLNISELKIIKYIIKYYNSMISNTINPYITKKIDTFKYSKDIGLLSPIKEKKIILTKEQENAIQNILNKKNKNHILLGITGSGKTHVYLEVIKHIYNQNKQSLILLPDIAITSQFYTKVKEVFPKETISIFHSKLTKKQKEIENNLINEGTRKIIIGARSALFARFNNLGIIIIDEFQDQNFKQDADPRYSTINVAKQVSLILNSKLVLVSATPLIEEYYRYKTGLYNLEKLTKRIPGSNKNIDLNLSIVDLKKEKNMIISKELSEKISESLKRKEKIILYVNRRGYSPLLICQKCKYIELCPRCEIPITVHKNYNNTYYLNCHHCEYTTTKINYLCPMCSNSVMKFYGVGTQSVKEEIQSIFLGKKLNIIIPLQPVFMLNFYNEFLINYYDNGIPMFTINWISIVNSNILENLNSDINTNPTSIFNFIDNQNYDLGNYDMPYTFYDGKQLIKFYFELVDTVYFTYILHVYKFAIKNYQPIIHSIYICHNENDTNLINLINNYISKNNINNNAFLIFYSYDIEQINIDLYPQNFVVGLNSNMLNSFKPQQYEEPQFIAQYRHTYQPYQYVTYQVNENTEYILTT